MKVSSNELFAELYLRLPRLPNAILSQDGDPSTKEYLKYIRRLVSAAQNSMMLPLLGDGAVSWF